MLAGDLDERVSYETPPVRAAVGEGQRAVDEALGRETLAVAIELDCEPAAGADVSDTSVDGEPLRLGLTLSS